MGRLVHPRHGLLMLTSMPCFLVALSHPLQQGACCQQGEAEVPPEVEVAQAAVPLAWPWVLQAVEVAEAAVPLAWPWVQRASSEVGAPLQEPLAASVLAGVLPLVVAGPALPLVAVGPALPLLLLAVWVLL